MFTGIIQVVGEVAAVTPQSTGCRFAVLASIPGQPLLQGESIAVSGCCLTLVSAEPAACDRQRLEFDVVHQTLRMTTLGSLSQGRHVNLERAATPTTLLGGHIVQGHVDGVGEVTGVLKSGGEHRVRIKPPLELLRYVVDKGSIAVDGVSLTVAALHDSSLEVALIPATLAQTTLSELRQGDHVNLEADALAKMVERLLHARS